MWQGGPHWDPKSARETSVAHSAASAHSKDCKLCLFSGHQFPHLQIRDLAKR